MKRAATRATLELQKCFFLVFFEKNVFKNRANGVNQKAMNLGRMKASPFVSRQGLIGWLASFSDTHTFQCRRQVCERTTLPGRSPRVPKVEQAEVTACLQGQLMQAGMQVLGQVTGREMNHLCNLQFLEMESFVQLSDGCEAGPPAVVPCTFTMPVLGGAA